MFQTNCQKFLFIIIFLCEFSVHAVVGPQIINSERQAKIVLSEQVRRQLKRYKNFKVIELNKYNQNIRSMFYKTKNSLPNALVLDINGDKKNDIALIGFTKLKGKVQLEVIAAISNAKGFRIVPIKSWKLPNAALKIKDNGKIEGFWSIYLTRIKSNEPIIKNIPKNRKGIKLEAYMSSTEVFYLNSKKFVKIL